MAPQAIGDLETRLIDELRGMRDDFRQVLCEIGALTVEVRHLSESAVKAENHGERIRGLEESVTNLKSLVESAATERRWMVGMLVSVALGMIAMLLSLWKH